MFDMMADLGLVRKADGASPPEAVRAACRRGLDLADEYGGPGLTDRAKSRARSMAAGNSVSSETLGRMANFFSRHQQNRADPSAKEPTPGAVAWLIWGGDAGKAWAERQVGGDEAEKAGKRNLVGGNKGAWAYAKEQAKGKADPEKYAAAVYGRIAGKSLGTKNKGASVSAATAQQLYRKFLQKAATPSSAGLATHTLRSGKTVYHPQSSHYSHSFGPRETRQIAAHLRSKYKGFKPADHREAATHHSFESVQTFRANPKLSESHRQAAMMHEYAARRPRKVM